MGTFPSLCSASTQVALSSHRHARRCSWPKPTENACSLCVQIMHTPAPQPSGTLLGPIYTYSTMDALCFSDTQTDLAFRTGIPNRGSFYSRRSVATRTSRCSPRWCQFQRNPHGPFVSSSSLVPTRRGAVHRRKRLLRIGLQEPLPDVHATTHPSPWGSLISHLRGARAVRPHAPSRVALARLPGLRGC